MFRQRSLRFRIAVAFALFGATSALILTGLLLVAAHDQGQRLIDETLTAELDDYLARLERNPNSLPPLTATLHGHVVKRSNQEELPPYLRSMSPGRHNVTGEGVTYRIVVADRHDTRLFMLYDTSLQNRREGRFALLLGATGLVLVLLSGIAGAWWGGRIIAPVTELARRVHDRKPEAWNTPLADEFAGDAVGELAHVFDRHMDRMRAFIERERSFTSDLSHELRTSLAVIMTTTEILLADTSLADKQRLRLERIDRAARDMAELGSALLLMAREDNDLVVSQTCNLADVVEEAVEKHRFLLQDKPVRVHRRLDPEVIVVADRGLVFIVMANLVRNAFAYTREGDIRIDLDRETLTIADSGPGFSAADGHAVFTPPFRDATSRGAGIGLTLVKRIADRYHWKVTLESKRGVGSTFRVHFFPRGPH
ncbi:MAG: HAMP domain-containing histidine kinase [Magnetococcales bacterium]|nr:HAMP domain-containing histidine kinase [Magnetococcales bacterium]MBF0157543.1 HAMP domain-containing histidine kinase [Magnetococcales bacterium]